MAEDLVDGEIIIDVPNVKFCVIDNVSGRRGPDVPGTFQVIRVHHKDSNEEVFMVKAGEATLALTPAVPVLRVTDAHWILPLPSGFHYGVQFADGSQDDEFEELCAHIACYQDLEAPDANGMIVSALSKTGEGIEKGADIAAHNIKKGASMAGKGMHKMSNMAMSKLKPRSKEVHVSEGTRQKLKTGKAVSGAACKVSASLVMGVAAMAATLGHLAADEIDKQLEHTKWGQKLKSKSGPKTAASKEVIKKSFAAYVTVFTAMEEAAWVMLSEAASSSSEVIEHRYGEEAGEASKDVFAIGGNVGKTAYYSKSLGTKAVIKAAAKATAVDLASSSEEREASKSSDKKDTLTSAAAVLLH